MKLRFHSSVKAIAVSLAILVGYQGAIGRVQAMVVPAEAAANAAAIDRAGDLRTVQTAIEHKKVKERLLAFGLTEDQIQQRLQKLSDAQLHQLAMQVDKHFAAGDSSDETLAIGLIVGVLLVALIVWLVRAMD